MNGPLASDRSSRVVYFSALYDLIITAPMASPWTAQWLEKFWLYLHESQALSGNAPSLEPPLAMLFANLLGSLTIIWSIVRLRRPQLSLGAADTAVRLIFSVLMLHAIFNGASGILWYFLATELLWAIVQGTAVWRGLRE